MGVDLAKVDLVCANRPCDNRCQFRFFLKTVEKKREGFVNVNRTRLKKTLKM